MATLNEKTAIVTGVNSGMAVVLALLLCACSGDFDDTKEKAPEQHYSGAKFIYVVTDYGQTCGQPPPPPPRFAADASYSPKKAKK